jgi:hypothetical protein
LAEKYRQAVGRASRARIPKAGRPTMPDKARRSATVTCQITPAELGLLDAKVNEYKTTRSNYVRALVLKDLGVSGV